MEPLLPEPADGEVLGFDIAVGDALLLEVVDAIEEVESEAFEEVEMLLVGVLDRLGDVPKKLWPGLFGEAVAVLLDGVIESLRVGIVVEDEGRPALVLPAVEGPQKAGVVDSL